jgi:hypothetical protein
MAQVRVLAVIFTLVAAVFGQAPRDVQFKLALPEHKGQLQWSAPGFKVIELSAKSNGNEVGVRGRDQSGKVTFLGFLFVFSDIAPLSSAKCRDGILGPAKKQNSTLKIVTTSELPGTSTVPVSLVTYTANGADGKTIYSMRGFTATNDICGDLELYSDAPLSGEEPSLKSIFASYQFNETYVPNYKDVMLYAQILYDHHMYPAAGPKFELALAKLREQPEGDVQTMTRVLTDQAGMAYGISGNLSKSRSLFEKGIATDPDYPMYYYNLACADAEEKNLSAAREHLQKAFERKANVLKGESMPDPTKDDSFLPYRSNKDFWAFLESLRPQS